MRCLALAEAALARSIPTTFVSDTDDAVADPLRARSLAVVPSGRAWQDEIGPGDLVVVDGYHLTDDDLADARRRGATTARITDTGAGHHDVDVLVDPNPVAAPRYDVPSGRVLVGPRYALVREEFRSRSARVRSVPDTLLLTFGGSDPAGVGRLLLPVLERHRPFATVLLLVGPAAPSPRFAAPWLEVVVSPPSVADVLAGADAAVAAAGGTTWELLTMGVPTALVQVADNQAHVFDGTVRLGAALALGRAPLEDGAVLRVLDQLARPDVRDRLRRRGQELVDGGGADRVLDALLAVHP